MKKLHCSCNCMQCSQCKRCCLDAFRSRSKKKAPAEKKKVVVVGGGVGGSLLCRSLQSFADLVLIDEKEYYDIPWARLRSVVEPSFAERSVIDHREYLNDVKLVVSAAVNVTEYAVTTARGETLEYDYLVIATGHIDPASATKDERLCSYRAEYEKLKSANSVLIVGGGPTGVELAGEISVMFPDKKVILVHRGMRLLEFIGSRAAKMAMKWLASKKVEVVVDQNINLNSLQDGTIETTNGNIIKADCHFSCMGNPIGSGWLSDSILKDCLDIQGRLMVDKYLRVRGKRNIFAIGDITNIQEVKQGHRAEKHARLTARNLKVLMTGGNERKMSAYKPGSTSAVIALGRKEGLAEYPLMTFCGWIPGRMKARDLYVGKTRKQLGLKPKLERKY